MKYNLENIFRTLNGIIQNTNYRRVNLGNLIYMGVYV